ncbi:MAG: porin [Puniceicoccales bacterium]
MPLLSRIALLGLLLAAPLAQAADEELIRLLEQKGYLSEKEANEIIESDGSFDFKPNSKRTEELTVGALLQFQYNYMQAQNGGGPNPATRNNFQLRRAYLILEGKIGEGFGAVIVPNFGDAKARLDHAYVYKEIENPDMKFYAGLRKVRFDEEEYSSTSKLRTIERSLVTDYWGNDTGTENQIPEGTEANGDLGFAAQHMGLFGDWKIDDNFGAELALVNGYASSSPGNTFQNKIGVYAQLRSSWDLSSEEGETMKLQAGINTGYQASGNSYWQPTANGASASATNLYIGNSDSDASSIGVNPYVIFQWDGFMISGEFLMNWVENGKLYDNAQLSAASGGNLTASSQAVPWGIVVTPSYRFFDDYEVVFQYAYINTDGRGVQIDGTVPNAPDVGRLFFQEAQSFYLGFNWYILGDDLKFQFGYSYLDYSGQYNMPNGGIVNPESGSFTGAGYGLHIFRGQVQVIF